MTSPFIRLPWELVWVDNKSFLDTRGYIIHPKYDPSWRPSDERQRQEVERGVLPRWTLASAIRKSDEATVMLKTVLPDSWELRIGSFFSDPLRVAHPRNHCIRIYEVLQNPEHPEYAILVMPLLYGFDTLPFDTVGEVVDCVRQLIEGIQYMHENRIAHRDGSFLNVMMDATKIFPSGFHPGVTTKKKDFSGRVHQHATRTMVWPRYFLIDFGHSRQYDPAIIPYEEKISGGDRTAPEHRTPGFGCNPFPTDIYYLGNLVRERFLDCPADFDVPKRVGLEFLRPLINDMINPNPAERPTIDDVAQRYHALILRVKTSRLRSRCQLEDHSSLFWQLGHLKRRIQFQITSHNAVPHADPPPAVLTSRSFYTQERIVTI